MSCGQGGAHAGAGRKPKELRYWSVAQDVEDRIAQALPAVIEIMIDMAKAGDISAARYLCDRILGRTAALEAPPSVDRTIPYTDRDFEDHRPHLLEPEDNAQSPEPSANAGKDSNVSTMATDSPAAEPLEVRDGRLAVGRSAMPFIGVGSYTNPNPLNPRNHLNPVKTPEACLGA